MNIDEIIFKIKDDELKEVKITKENGRYRGEIHLSDPTKKLSITKFFKIKKKLTTEINLFLEDFTKIINDAFFSLFDYYKTYDEVNLEDEFDLENAEFQKAKKIDGEK